MTTFVTMYHPALNNVRVQAPLEAESLYEAHGWVLDGGTAPPPDAITLTVPLGDLRYLKLGDLTASGTATGDGLKAAFDARSHGTVCFTWDDGFASHYSQVFQLAQTLGQRHTFCVVSGLLGTANYMTSTQVQAVAAAGHEIANHSKTHPRLATGGLNLAQQIAEYDDSQAALVALGIPAPTTFSYPNGDRNATTDQQLWLRFKRALMIGPGWSPAGLLYDRTQLLRNKRFIYRYPLGGTTQSFNMAMELIRRASVEPIIVVFYSHDIGAAGSVTLSQMQSLMQYAAQVQVPCRRIDETFPAEPSLIDGGFEDATLGSWTVFNSDANQTATSVADAPAAGLNGSRSLQLTTTTTSSFVYATQGVPVVPGVEYKLSGQVRLASVAGAGFYTWRIRWIDTLNNQISANTTTSTNPTWATQTLTATAPPQAAWAYVDMLLQNLQGNAYADHLDFSPTREGTFG